VTALNLIPIGSLDGGHIIHAMFGQQTAALIGQITRILMIVLAFIQSHFLLWAILFIFMPLVDQPALNDVTELDDWRDFIGLLSIVLLISILLPFPGQLAQFMNV
jgi:membrane-associated protease RseP (regulator of RpoE activity)